MRVTRCDFCAVGGFKHTNLGGFKHWFGIVLNDYDAVLPLIFKRKWGLHYLCQSSFYQRTAIFAKEKPSESVKKKFFEAIPQKFILQDFCIDEYSVLDKLKKDKRQNLILSLDKTYDELKSLYPNSE